MASGIESKQIECVDVMPLDRDTVTLILCDGPFSATGHFPILACSGELGKPLYLALIFLDGKHQFKVGTVQEGESTAVYFDDSGDTKETMDFQILVLRHDPIDKFSNNSCRACNPLWPRMGAMDPTGPMHWVQYFPQRNTDLIKDATGCLKEHESHFLSWKEEHNVDFNWGPDSTSVAGAESDDAMCSC